MISIDGVIVPEERATVSVLDRGFLYGDGLFEILRTWNGTRSISICTSIGCARPRSSCTWPSDRAAITRTVGEVIAATEGEQRLRIIVTRGQGGVTARFADVRGGHTIVIAEAARAPGPKKSHRSALRSSTTRSRARRPRAQDTRVPRSPDREAARSRGRRRRSAPLRARWLDRRGRDDAIFSSSDGIDRHAAARWHLARHHPRSRAGMLRRAAPRRARSARSPAQSSPAPTKSSSRARFAGSSR